jgi:hypothetical protein
MRKGQTFSKSSISNQPMTEFCFRSGRILCRPPWQWFGSRKLSSYGIHMTAVIQLGLDVGCCHAPGSPPHGHRARHKLYTTNRTHVRDRNYSLSNVDQDLLSLEEQCKTRFLFSVFHKTISVGTLVHHLKKYFRIWLWIGGNIRDLWKISCRIIRWTVMTPIRII